MKFFHSTFLLFCLTGLSACDRPAVSAPATQPAGAPVRVTVAPVKFVDLPTTVTASGSLFGDEQATISAKVSGRIGEIFADVGDRVGPGGKLAQIDATDYEISASQKKLAVKEALAKLGLSEIPDEKFDPTLVATVERARFQRDNAKAKLDRVSTLMTNNPPPISAQEFADMQTEFEVARRDFDSAVLDAQAQLAMARARAAETRAAEQLLADTTIRAPLQPTSAPADHFAIAARLVSPGEFVSAGTALFRVVSDRPIKFRGAVPERYSSVVKVGQEALLRVDGVGDVPAKVSRVSPAIDPLSRTFEVEIQTPNTDGRLRPGGFARATIRVGAEQQVSVVPSEAIISFAGVDRVFIVKDGKAVGTRITPGDKLPEGTPIKEKLPPDTQVILRGDRGVADGIAVTIATTTAPN